jgi:hypothetical protein
MPVDPREDELVRNWSLMAAIAACRGADQLRRFALQLSGPPLKNIMDR